MWFLSFVIIKSTNWKPPKADELDNLMDISIEIASNKRMKKDYIKPFKLTFKDKEMEKKVCMCKFTKKRMVL